MDMNIGNMLSYFLVFGLIILFFLSLTLFVTKRVTRESTIE